MSADMRVLDDIDNSCSFKVNLMGLAIAFSCAKLIGHEQDAEFFG